MEIIRAPIAHVRKYGPRIAIYPRIDIYIPTSLFPSTSYNVLDDHRAYTVPSDIAHKIPSILKDRYPDDRITIEPELLASIERTLQVERQSFALTTAETADIPLDILSLIPRPFQRAGIAFGLSQGSFLLSFDMGLGKTLTATYLAEHQNRPTLWLTKASLVLNLEAEIRKLTGKSVCIFSGRYPTEEDYKAFLSGKFSHYIINYEVVGTKDLEVKEEKEIASRPWVNLFNLMAQLGFIKQIVADEAHACKNPEALRTQALLRLNAEYRIPMTGTAIVNRAGELWTLLHWIDPKRFASETSFASTYLNEGDVKDVKLLQKDLSPYLFRRRTKDVIKDLPSLIRITHTVELSPQFKSRYELALDNIYQALDGSETGINGILAQLNRLREIVADAKVDHTYDYVRSLLDEDDEARVLIFSNYRLPGRTLAKRFNANCIYGDVPQWERLSFVNSFNADLSQRVLCLTVPTGQEGFNITGANTAIFNDLAWTPKDHNQAVGRFYGRLNDLHGGTAVYLEIDKTIDQFMNRLLEKKQEAIDTVEGMTGEAKASESMLSEVLGWLKGSR